VRLSRETPEPRWDPSRDANGADGWGKPSDRRFREHRGSSPCFAIDNGVVVDEHLLAGERVGAIGDVAHFAWPSVTGTEPVRIEHWEVANGHALSLAHYWMTGEVHEVMMVPYFWSDQYGKKIQMLGHPRPDDEVVRVGASDDGGQWVALYSRDGVVTGVVTLGKPRALMLSRTLLEVPTTLDQAHARAPWSS
jgi:3-phenylpropionate/trans-cinnamate dioxygenase ferredoxin reductase subunit